MDTETKNYEFAYWLPPTVAENEVAVRAAKLAAAVEGAGGVVVQSHEPYKRQLAYPVNRERTGYFGWIAFRIAPAALDGIERQMHGEGLMRFLFIAEAKGATRAKARLERAPMRRREPAKILRAEEDADAKLDLEALDKKLEEILGK